jgi:tripartite-type tricarboxylate transporter receptor subunit TctC
MKLQILAVLLAAVVGHAVAQSPAYPAKPLRLIVSAGPGSVVDLRARQLASKLPDLLGQPLVVDGAAEAEDRRAAAAGRLQGDWRGDS